MAVDGFRGEESSPPQANEAWLRALLRDESFMMFMQEQPSRYIDKEAFLRLPMPGGLDPETAWDFVSFMRRMAGSPPVRSASLQLGQTLEQQSYWNIPFAIAEMLNDVYVAISESSQLWSGLEPLLKSGRFFKPLVEDLLACSERDGFSVDYEIVRALVLEERCPVGNQERIIFNTATVLKDIDGFGEVASASFLENVYRRITEGVVVFDGVRENVPTTPYPELFVVDEPKTFDEVASELFEGPGWGSHPLLDLVMCSGTIWNRWPFPHCNEFMELAIRWAGARYAGVPALRGVPLSKLRYDWERGLVKTERTLYRYGEAVAVSDFGVDCTPYLIVMANLIDIGVAKLEGEVAKIQETDALRKAALLADFRLTYRQQRLLCDMVDNPRFAVDVSTYAARFDIATSTARDDLNKLVALGFCLTEMQGKKQVFWARPASLKALAGYNSTNLKLSI